MQLIFSKDKAKIYIFFRKAINMIFYFPKKEKKVFIEYSFYLFIKKGCKKRSKNKKSRKPK